MEQQSAVQTVSQANANVLRPQKPETTPNDNSIRILDIVERLAAFPENGVTFYGPKGKVERKSYADLHADVMAAFERLRGWGVETGMRVGLLATNSYEWIVYHLALMHLRCTSVCLAEEFGSEERDEVFEKYGLSLLLLLKRDSWPKMTHGEHVAYMDAENAPDTRAKDYIAPPIADDYVISLVFSSGTTGNLKCMVANYPGIEDSINLFQNFFPVTRDDSILVFLPISSIQQHYMLYAALFFGFDLYLIKPPQLFAAFKSLKPSLCVGPPLLYETIHNQFKNGVRNLGTFQRLAFHTMSTLMEVVPSTTLRNKLLQACYGKLYSSLGGRIKYMWTGMAPIKRSTLDFFAKARVPLYEAYGLSECGLIATNTPAHRRLGSVGKPIDEGIVQLSEEGEIIVHKKHLSTTGYFGGEGDEGKSTYLQPGTVATGDIGRFDDEGYLYLVGRKKDLIITRQGYKVHPERLEAQIDKLPEVDRSVVFGSDMPYLVAVISVQGTIDDELRSKVESHVEKINAELPQAGRVVKFHITDQQFTLQNGLMTRNLKLNRRALLKHFEKDLV